MLFLQKRAQRQTVREWAISADANDTRQDDKVWWCVTQHITAGICGDAASYKYVVQVATRYSCPSRWVPASLHGIDAACGIVPLPGRPKSVRSVVVEGLERDVM